MWVEWTVPRESYFGSMWNIRFPSGNCTTTIRIIGWMVTEEHRNGKENGPRQERAPLLLLDLWRGWFVITETF